MGLWLRQMIDWLLGEAKMSTGGTGTTTTPQTYNDLKVQALGDIQSLATANSALAAAQATQQEETAAVAASTPAFASAIAAAGGYLIDTSGPAPEIFTTVGQPAGQFTNLTPTNMTASLPPPPQPPLQPTTPIDPQA